MAKWCFNYESGEYEYIEKDGFSIDRGEYVCNWDDSQYRREEEEQRNSLFDLTYASTRPETPRLP